MRSLKFVALAILAITPVAVIAAKLSSEGQEWLDQHKDAPGVNVTGTWESRDWGKSISLTQTNGDRSVAGTDGKFDLAGVVSGKDVYLLFTHKNGAIGFCATLVSDSDNTMTGTYSYPVTRLRLGHGLCQSKGYPLRLKRQ